MSESVMTLTESSFYETINGSDVPILVDFWAEWCGPCKQLAPVLEEIAVEKSDVLRVGKVNIDEAMGVAFEYEVKSIPTLLFFIRGEAVAEIVGAKPKKAILEMVEGAISGDTSSY